MRRLVLPFALHGLPGHVSVEFAPNDDPESVGSRPTGHGFPVCTARVRYGGLGYLALLGWIQFVRSTDNESRGKRFELDPLEPFGELPHPFCWLGIAPTLFDAPSRVTRDDLEWTARSFLCVPDDHGEGPEVSPLLGFAWGFRISGGEVALAAPRPLDAAVWNEHVEVLRRDFPRWRFTAVA
jgi:hypothetical protein